MCRQKLDGIQAAALLALVGPDAHDDALGLDARAQDYRAGQTEGEK